MVKLSWVYSVFGIVLYFESATGFVSEFQQPYQVPAQDPNDLYNEAIGLLSTIRERKSYKYTEYNIGKDLDIPSFDDESLIDFRGIPKIQRRALSLLETCASLNHTGALNTLAEIELFGNFSIPHNSKKALEHYERLVSIKPDANAYYMLGFIYATGLFGDVEVNQPKANLYFHFGMENGDLRSTMVLAYRYLNGISLENNCGLSLTYYSYLASQTKKLIMEAPIGGPNIDTFAIRIPDFKGGLFGNDASESANSLVRTKQNHGYDKKIFNEINIDPEDHESVSLYYEAVINYEGDYFTKRDYAKAFEIAHQCSLEGSASMRRPSDLDKVDIVFISKCYALLGHMYLRGEGTNADNEKALYWLKKAKDTFSSAANNDLGLIYEHGLGVDPDIALARSFYQAASDSRSADGMFNLARLRINQNSNDKESLNLMQGAAYVGSIEAVYSLAQLYERGLGDKSCETCAAFYKAFVETMEPLVTSLDWAFDELLQGNYRNALIGYAMAAEQGYESAQVSASYILYQPRSKYERDLHPVDRDHLIIALNYLIRSSKQNNFDSTVAIGDIYYAGLLDGKPDYEKAVSSYQTGVNQHSAQSCFNLGYMYEHGLGVDKDFHLAKRYYDLALEYQPSAYLPVKLAILNLKLKSFFTHSLEDEESVKSGAASKEKKTFKDWLNLFNKARLGNVEQPTSVPTSGSQTTFNRDARNSQAQQTHDLEDENTGLGNDDWILVLFFFSTFGIFYLMHLRNQRRVRQRNQAQNQQDGAAENPAAREGLNFQFNFWMVPL